ncbi:Auxin efflux carrier family protein [Sulfitobacter noctilucae]|uniref:AEC family transporter n=1 Tax=Sulfitobacter noctilucae TaxID=1342302 RepID=UPI00046AAB13|nr:AEC family transporter [Sulfitobacter noctilucae]KIN75268.1 Auxin efflux carrier family protein [Sulfitobacter noctilucae]
MNLVLTVLEIVAPVFILAGIGFGWVKLGFEYRLEFVTRLSMTLAVPCLIFTALVNTSLDPAALTTLTLASLVAYIAVSVITLGSVRLLRLHQGTFAAPLIFGNTGNLGLPLALFAFGETGFEYAVVVFAVMAIISFTFGIWLVAGAGSFTKVLKEPLVWATVLGAVFLWQGWTLPRVLDNTMGLIGQMAIPLMLITLGVAVARLTPSGIGRAVVLSLVKLAICIGCAWLAADWFALDKTAFGILVLQVATPVAVTSYMLAEKYGADAQSVAGLVVVSTVMSIGALPLLLAVLL